MKNSIFGWARNSDQAHTVVDHLKQIGISDVSVVQPTTGANASHGQVQGQNINQNPKKPTNTNDQYHSQQGHSVQQGHNTQQNYNQTSSKGSTSFPSSNVSLKSLNIPSADIKKFEENQKAGQFLIAVQSDNNEKLDKAQDLFKKEGLKDIISTREKAKSSH